MLRGAVIGLGNIALRGHLPAYRAEGLEGAVKIVAACDLAPAAGETCRNDLEGVSFYRDAREMISREKPDFLDICTPPSTHPEYIREAAAAGAHIICEKPLAESLSSLEEVAASLDGRPLVFVPCHQYRYSPLWSTIAGVLAEGKIGSVTLAQFNVYRMQADRGSEAGNPAWRTDRALSGGGILVDTGAHYFYLIQQMFGLPHSVDAVLRSLKHPGYGVEDTALVTLNYPGSAVQISLTWAADARGNSLFISGSEGNLRYDGRQLLLTRGSSTVDLPMPDISDKGQYVGWYASLFGEFAERVRNRNYSDDLFRESVNVMKLLDVSYRSGRERRTVEFP